MSHLVVPVAVAVGVVLALYWGRHRIWPNGGRHYKILMLIAGIAFIGLGIARYVTGAGYGPPNHVMGIIFIAGGSLVVGLYFGRMRKDPHA
jgi:hypothetical protein